jgi:hypothetical protein
MTYYLEDIKEDVRIVLDENQVSDNMMTDIDTLSVDDIIRSKVEEAAKVVYLAAPAHLLEPGNNFADSIAWNETEGIGPGWTILPDDFLRLVSFKMSDWERPVYSAILPDDPLYLQQSSRFAGIRGNRQRPVCAIVMRPQGRVLEFYSCSAGTGVSVDMAVYAPMPKIEHGSIDIYERCYRSVVYKTAGLVAINLGETDKAKVLFEISNELLK